MNWQTFQNLRSINRLELSELLIFDDQPIPHLHHTNPSPLASVASFAVWENNLAQPPVWPMNQIQFDADHWGNRLKKSILVLATNPSGVGDGPLLGNFHVSTGRSKDFRLARAFSMHGICSNLHGAYMTDLLKTVRGPKIRKTQISQQILQCNVDLFNAEMEVLQFAGLHPRFILVLGSGTGKWLCYLRNNFDLQIADGTTIMQIHHHSSALEDVLRDQEFAEVQNQTNNILQQNNIASFA